MQPQEKEEKRTPRSDRKLRICAGHLLDARVVIRASGHHQLQVIIVTMTVPSRMPLDHRNDGRRVAVQ